MYLIIKGIVLKVGGQNMTYKEFKFEVQNLNSSRKHKVTNSVGVYSVYKIIRKNHWYNIGRPLTEKEFYSIIRTFNKHIADELSKGNDFTLPYKMGTLEIRKYSPNITIKDGKLNTPLPIDWDKTLKLWYEDKESYDKKTLVRSDVKEIFRLIYNKSKAEYINKSFYELRFNREIKKKLKQNIKEGLIDAFLLK